jgi:subtilase family serine protease
MGRSRRVAPRFERDSIEKLEDRLVMSVALPHHPQQPHAAEVQVVKMEPNRTLVESKQESPNTAHTFLYKLGGRTAIGQTLSPPPGALNPAESRHIYAVDEVSDLGSGQTIAIVDAYDDPNIASDADLFDQQFNTTLTGSTSYYTAYGAASTWLTKTSPSGVLPPGNSGWGQEISLDVEWMHAIAPMARIVLVEAASNSFFDLLAADSYAATTMQATVISNSWGGGEFSGQTRYDSTFQVSGVTFVFSAGDSGDQSYPAETPYVVAVGGTHLTHDSNYNWTGESGWSSGGGGVSRYEARPSYQSSLGYRRRANPDVAYDADLNTGFAVYDSYGGYAWGQYGGTSAGAPQWSAIIAIANEARVDLYKSILDGTKQTLPAIYATTTSTTSSQQLFDVTSGRNRVGSAGPGFDLVTGRGTPRRADLVYQALVAY